MGVTKENKKLIRLGLIYIVALLLIAYFIPRQHNWSPSFSKNFEWPFGSMVVFDQLRSVFSDHEPLVVTDSYYEEFKDTSFIDHNLIIINTSFYPDSLDMAQIFNFVRSGNQAFISCEQISPLFLDSIGIEMNSAFNANLNNISEGADAYIELGLVKEEIDNDSLFRFKAMRYYHYFSQIDSTKSSFQLGTIRDKEVGFIRVPYGEGNFFLHSFPYAFTNYHILNEKLTDYLSASLSHLPNQKVIWDEYFKITRQNQETTPLQVLLRSESFRWAYWIGISTLFLFILFYAKRRQRIIPVIKEFKNDSLEFTKTISLLYYQKKDNRDLALKKINYFRDFIGAKYQLKAIKFTEEDAEDLNQKSEYSLSYIQKLFRQINNIKANQRTSDAELKVLTEKMNKIYNRKKV